MLLGSDMEFFSDSYNEIMMIGLLCFCGFFTVGLRLEGC